MPQSRSSPGNPPSDQTKKINRGRRKNEYPEAGNPASIADLSRLELACLNVLWQMPGITVRDIRQALFPVRPLAYTTVMTILDRMHAKRAVRRSKRGKTFFYEPALDRQDACGQSLRSLLDLYFGGSVDKLQDYLRQSTTPPSASREAWNEMPEDLL